jgi:ABC-2 type transport system permease protein
MRFLSVFRKCVREQQRDLWVLGLSLAFAPLFVFIYWLWTGGASGSTTYGVLVMDQDQPASLADGGTLAAGAEIVAGLQDLAYENGSPLLRVRLVDDRAAAEKRLRDREAAILVILPPELSRTLAAYRQGDPAASTGVTFVGDLSNPVYTVAAVMVMTVADNYVNAATQAPRPVALIEVPLGASAARSEFENYVPGVIVLAVTLLVFQAAMTPARDIESGTLRRLRLTRLTTFEYLGGTTAWLSIVAAAEVLLTFATAVALGFRSQGPIWAALLIGLVTGLSIMGIGLIVACFSKTVSQAFVIANFPLGILMFLTGAIYPVPQTTLFTVFGHAVTPASVLPPTHAVIALNKIFTLGAGWGEVVFELGALTLLSAAYFAAGVWLFQRTQMRRQV